MQIRLKCSLSPKKTQKSKITSYTTIVHLYSSPIVDYISIIWAPNTTKSMITRLDANQRIVA